MREIKFRVWSQEFKKIIYQDEYGCFNDVYTDGGYKQTIGLSIALKRKLPVMQFTGLLDKNEKEIYEGDVLGYFQDGKLISKEIVQHKVIQKSETYGHGDYGNSLISGFYFGVYYGLPDKQEILGNIYQNPELLEVK